MLKFNIKFYTHITGAAAKSRTVKSEFAAGIAISIIVCVLGVGIFYLAIFGGGHFSAPSGANLGLF